MIKISIRIRPDYIDDVVKFLTLGIEPYTRKPIIFSFKQLTWDGLFADLQISHDDLIKLKDSDKFILK